MIMDKHRKVTGTPKEPRSKRRLPFSDGDEEKDRNVAGRRVKAKRARRVSGGRLKKRGESRGRGDASESGEAGSRAFVCSRGERVRAKRVRRVSGGRRGGEGKGGWGK